MAKQSKPPATRVCGLMSGTSADGVDAAIVDIDRNGVRLVAFRTFPYTPALRKRIFEVCSPMTAKVDDICHLNFALGEVFAAAVIELARKNRIPLASIDLIGSHGQTIQHLPAVLKWEMPSWMRRRGRRFLTTRSTLQIAEPSVIAERTGIAVVADFRPRDIAAGGQGAPLVPMADLMLLGHARLTRASQNIGGIGNVTFLRAGGGVDDVLAFDTGPGNMIIDRLADIATGGRLGYDKDGRLAARGTVDEALLSRLMRHPFLRRRPPKTTGREEFGRQFADKVFGTGRARGLSPADIIATATAFTARSIADAYARHLPARVDEVILCGGGASNPTLVWMLREALTGGPIVRNMRELGIDPDAKEAISFALLAYLTVHGLPGNVPSATGAARQVVLGKIVPGRQ